MIVFCDDGSTATKLAWLDSKKKLVTKVMTNGFIPDWKSDVFNKDKSFNYVLEGQKFAYSPNSIEIEVTTNVKYQYSHINALNVQQALQFSGLTPQGIDLVVTLPISEYYDTDGQENTQKIERKIENIKREIYLSKGTVFTFKNVVVYPESLPVLVAILGDDIDPYERSLVCDLGGTTFDCGLVMGAFADVLKVSGDHTIGTQLLIKEISNALIKADTHLNFNHVDVLVRRLLTSESIESMINNPDSIPLIKEQLELSMKKLAHKCLDHIERNYDGFNKIYLTGGGANLVYELIKQHWEARNVKVIKVDDSQLALVKALTLIHSDSE
ncbi:MULTISPECIES: plasmid segregation protein ParM domain-containing protein [unclassified Providencia]|uniref:plasmid segregation protein ParM domain-containing protein n=1 Tax=unclassified Providencia TaxID=2633465 RepID=UPI00234B5800|nr:MULTISPECIES: plasmid segregation protein ParM domain-containing protein [unclassified Providencia]